MSARWDGYPSAEQPSDLGWRLCLQVPGSVDKVDYPGISPTFRGELGGPGLYPPVKEVPVQSTELSTFAGHCGSTSEFLVCNMHHVEPKVLPQACCSLNSCCHCCTVSLRHIVSGHLQSFSGNTRKCAAS